MGYFKGFFTSLGITIPSFLFIHIYLNGLWVRGFFQNLFGGEWTLLLEICETIIVEPINVFFVPFNALNVFLIYAPWLVSAFTVSFFFKKKHAARGGLVTLVTLYFIAEIVYYLVIQHTVLYVSTLTQPNPLYGFLVILAIITIFGLFFGLISPFKKESTDKLNLPKTIKGPAVMPTSPPIQSDYSAEEPYYMPSSSPSRDEYMTQYESTNPARTQQSTSCEYCGSYVDSDTEFCSVCGNRVKRNY